MKEILVLVLVAVEVDDSTAADVKLEMGLPQLKLMAYLLLSLVTYRTISNSPFMEIIREK